MARLAGTVVLLIMLFLTTAFSVAGFEVSVTSPEAAIYPNETAIYTITVTNTKGTDEKIELMLGFDPKWSFETNPQSYLSSFTVPAGEAVLFDLLITPTSEYLSSGKYALSIPLKSDSAEENVDLLLQVKNPYALTDYLPSLNFLLDAQESIDPRQISRVKLEIRNRNVLNISEMEIILTSALYNETKITSVDPLGTTIVVFEISYDHQQPPTNDTLKLTVVVDEKVFTPIKKEIEIISYEYIVETQYPTKSFFFKTTETTEYVNKGNAPFTKEFKYPVTLWTQFFTSTQPEGEIAEEEGLLYYRTMALFPVDEPVVVTYSISYRPLIWLLLFVLLGIWGYYYFRSPVVVKKETATMHTDKDGKTKIKVLLHLKNRTMHLVDTVEITDKIPAVAEIEKHFELGTMKPEKILKHEKQGTVLVWKIPHLEAYEERIITYKVLSMYQIIGNFELPATTVQFKNKKQQLITVRSNAVKVGKKAEDK